jgi:hypothetical protein
VQRLEHVLLDQTAHPEAAFARQFRRGVVLRCNSCRRQCGAVRAGLRIRGHLLAAVLGADHFDGRVDNSLEFRFLVEALLASLEYFVA